MVRFFLLIGIISMFVSLNQFLTDWLGSAPALGAVSWLQALTWVATLIAALIGAVSLRRNTLQNRATLLLAIHKRWDDLEDQRHAFHDFYQTVRREVLKEHSGLQEKHQVDRMRKEFTTRLRELREQRDKVFLNIIALVNFFELIGMYVRNRYIPMRDIMQVYKGPILTLDIVCRNFIKVWEEDAQTEKGLLEFNVYLMDVTRTRKDRPLYYWAVYRHLRRFFVF